MIIFMFTKSLFMKKYPIYFFLLIIILFNVIQIAQAQTPSEIEQKILPEFSTIQKDAQKARRLVEDEIRALDNSKFKDALNFAKKAQKQFITAQELSSKAITIAKENLTKENNSSLANALTNYNKAIEEYNKGVINISNMKKALEQQQRREEQAASRQQEVTKKRPEEKKEPEKKVTQKKPAELDPTKDQPKDENKKTIAQKKSEKSKPKEPASSAKPSETKSPDDSKKAESAEKKEADKAKIKQQEEDKKTDAALKKATEPIVLKKEKTASAKDKDPATKDKKTDAEIISVKPIFREAKEEEKTKQNQEIKNNPELKEIPGKIAKASELYKNKQYKEAAIAYEEAAGMLRHAPAQAELARKTLAECLVMAMKSWAHYDATSSGSEGLTRMAYLAETQHAHMLNQDKKTDSYIAFALGYILWEAGETEKAREVLKKVNPGSLLKKHASLMSKMIQTKNPNPKSFIAKPETPLDSTMPKNLAVQEAQRQEKKKLAEQKAREERLLVWEPEVVIGLPGSGKPSFVDVVAAPSQARITDFVQNFLQTHSQNDFQDCLKFYANKVKFFGKEFNSASLAKEKESYFKLYPQRQQFLDGDVAVKPLRKKTWQLTFFHNFSIANDRKEVTGRATTILKIRMEDDKLLIFEENGTVDTHFTRNFK